MAATSPPGRGGGAAMSDSAQPGWLCYTERADAGATPAAQDVPSPPLAHDTGCLLPPAAPVLAAMDGCFHTAAGCGRRLPPGGYACVRLLPLSWAMGGAGEARRAWHASGTHVHLGRCRQGEELA